jgi:hypothetical protein
MERRILVHVPVEVTKLNGDGPSVAERACIEDVSDFGCRFFTRRALQKGDTIGVKILGPYGNHLPDEESRLFEIMWVARKERGATVGARVLQGEKLAHVKLRPRPDRLLTRSGMNEVSEERRAGKRFLLHSLVEISGVDAAGLQFVENSRLEDVGDAGCRFSLRHVVLQGCVLGVEPLGPEGENFADEFPRMFLVV